MDDPWGSSPWATYEPDSKSTSPTKKLPVIPTTPSKAVLHPELSPWADSHYAGSRNGDADGDGDFDDSFGGWVTSSSNQNLATNSGRNSFTWARDGTHSPLTIPPAALAAMGDDGSGRGRGYSSSSFGRSSPQPTRGSGHASTPHRERSPDPWADASTSRASGPSKSMITSRVSSPTRTTTTQADKTRHEGGSGSHESIPTINDEPTKDIPNNTTSDNNTTPTETIIEERDARLLKEGIPVFNTTVFTDTSRNDDEITFRKPRITKKESNGLDSNSPARSATPIDEIPTPQDTTINSRRGTRQASSGRVQELVEKYDMLSVRPKTHRIGSGQLSQVGSDGISEDNEDEDDEDDEEGEAKENDCGSDYIDDATNQTTSTSIDEPDPQKDPLKTPEVNNNDDTIPNKTLFSDLKRRHKDVSFSVNLDGKIGQLFPQLPTEENLVDRLFIPNDPICDTFTTISERKTWHRLSRYGSMRQHNAGGADDHTFYSRITWADSSVRTDVVKIVRRWMEEGSASGTGVLGRGGLGGGGGMFNWDSKAAPLSMEEVFGPPSGRNLVQPSPRFPVSPWATETEEVATPVVGAGKAAEDDVSMLAVPAEKPPAALKLEVSEMPSVDDDADDGADNSSSESDDGQEQEDEDEWGDLVSATPTEKSSPAIPTITLPTAAEKSPRAHDPLVPESTRSPLTPTTQTGLDVILEASEGELSHADTDSDAGERHPAWGQLPASANPLKGLEALSRADQGLAYDTAPLTGVSHSSTDGRASPQPAAVAAVDALGSVGWSGADDAPWGAEASAPSPPLSLQAEDTVMAEAVGRIVAGLADLSYMLQ